MTIRVRLITSPTELTALGERYERMVLAAGPSGMFYRADWIERVWPYYRQQHGATIAFLLAERGSDLVGLAPLQLRTKDWKHAHQRVIEFLGATHDELDNWSPGFLFADPDPREQSECVEAFIALLLDHSRAWDLIDLRLVPNTCPTRQALRAALPGLIEVENPIQKAVVRLDCGWAAYRASRKKRLLRMLDRGERRLSEDGVRVTYDVSTSVTPERMRTVETIHRARQNQLRAVDYPRNSPFDNLSSASVFWSLVATAEAHSHLRAHWLLFNGRPAAFILAMSHAGTTFCFFNAIAPAADKYHPGNLLLARFIEHESTHHGVTLVDLMPGPNLSKELFSTEMQSYVQIQVPNPKHLLARTRCGWVKNAKQVRAALSRGLRKSTSW